MVLTLEITPELELQLRREADRKGLDAGRFVLNLLREQLGRTGTPLPTPPHRSETDLLEAVNQGLSAERWERYRELIAKRRAETLSPEEHAELIATSDEIEEANVHRVECLAELARRRGMSLDALMDQLGIKPSIDA